MKQCIRVGIKSQGYKTSSYYKTHRTRAKEIKNMTQYDTILLRQGLKQGKLGSKCSRERGKRLGLLWFCLFVMRIKQIPLAIQERGEGKLRFARFCFPP